MDATVQRERHPDLRSMSIIETRKDAEITLMSSPNCVISMDDPIEKVPDIVPQFRPLTSVLKASHELIDREDQRNALMRAYDRSKIISSQSELTLITGRSGTGKSTLAFQLKKHVEADSGYFLLGKFEQNQNIGLPYHALTMAFTDFVQQVMKRDEQEAHVLKLRIHQAIESDLKLLTDLIPTLEQLVQDLGEPSSVMGADLQPRFKRVMCRFVRAIASPNSPVVLMLDDLQWSDASSLDLLRDIVVETQAGGFMIMGACRGDEVSRDHQLSVLLRDLECSQHTQINEIHVSNLNLSAVNTYLSQLFSLPKEKCKFLSAVVHENTDGNIFFLKRYVRSLVENNLIFYDQCGSLTWDNDLIRSSRLCYDVVHLISTEIRVFGGALQRVLEVGSCLGSGFDERILNLVLSDEVDVKDALCAASGMELLLVDEQSRAIRFVHDKIEQASYSLIPEDESASFHLELGRKLWNRSSEEDLFLNIFLIVNQLSIGADLVESVDERSNIASLCLHAAEKASVASAFLAAATYLDRGIQFLSKRHWRDEYDISLALYSAQCEVEYILGHFDKMAVAKNAIFENARSFHDKLPAYTIKVYALGAKSQPEQAITTGLEVLENLGERFPAKGRTIYIIRDFFRTKALLRRVSHESIINMRAMQDRDELAAMRILAILVPYTFSCKPEFLPLITFRMIRLTLKGGICAISSPAFAAYGLLLTCAFGCVEEGYNYGQLSLELAYKFKMQEWYPRCFTAVYGMINTWKLPLKDSLQHLRRSHLLGMSTGDIEFGMLSAAIYSTLTLLSTQRTLVELSEEMRGFRQSMIECKQDGMLVMLLPTMQYAENLQGLAKDPIVLTGGVMDQEVQVRKALKTNNTTVLCTIYQFATVLGYYMGAYQAALAASKDHTKHQQGNKSGFGECEQRFFECLNALALARIESRRLHMRRARKKYKELEEIAKYGRSAVSNRLTLLKGEFAAVDGKVDLALSYFKASAEHAQSEGDRSDQALAYERAGIVLRDARLWNESRKYLNQACDVYEEWGATIRVQHIRSIIST